MARASMVRAGLAMLAAVNAAGLARAADTQAMLAPVDILVKAIKQGTATCPAGIFTADAAVMDDFPPYHWVAPGAGCAWYLALVGTDAASRAAFTALHSRISVGAPQFSRITGDTAYFVLPGLFLFDADPKTRIRQTASWLFTERRTAAGWQIAATSWAITSETPAH